MQATVTAPPQDAAPVTTTRPARRRHPTAAVAVLAAAAGVVLRLWPRGPLWLDEAQSVSFARLSLSSIPSALRDDGAPPLYYMVLHVWMAVFGDGDAAVRSLSVVASLAFVATISAFAWRVGGPVAAAATAVVASTTPYAVRYGTEARMYALVALEVSLALWAVDRALARPTIGRLAPVAVVTAALLYTHYWALYLTASVTVVLVAATVLRRRGRRPVRSLVALLLAIAAGGALWLPWVPTFLYQADHTGTPWARATLSSMLRITSGASDGGLLPALFVVLGVILAVLVHPLSGRIRLSPNAIAAVLVLCPVLAAIGALTSGSAYVSRYASVVFPLAVLLAGIAVTRLRSTAAIVGVLAVFAVGCSLLSAREAATGRTRAGMLADTIASRARDGDVVVYCPDQLAPAMHRVLEQRGISLDERVFPDGNPERVQWIDYPSRYAQSNPSLFASSVIASAGPRGAVWLVWSETYPPTQPRCIGLRRALDLRRTVSVDIADDGSVADHGGLRRYRP